MKLFINKGKQRNKGFFLGDTILSCFLIMFFSLIILMYTTNSLLHIYSAYEKEIINENSICMLEEAKVNYQAHKQVFVGLHNVGAYTYHCYLQEETIEGVLLTIYAIDIYKKNKLIYQFSTALFDKGKNKYETNSREAK